MKGQKKHTTWDSLPEFVTAQQIADFLLISRKSVYQLFQIPVDSGGIPHFEIGRTQKTDKVDLKQWIMKKKLDTSSIRKAIS